MLNTIVCGNCIDVMGRIGSGTIDAVITSPPYNEGHYYPEYRDKMSPEEYRLMLSNFVQQSRRVLAYGGALAVIISKRMFVMIIEITDRLGFELAYATRNVPYGRLAIFTNGSPGHVTENRVPIVDFRYVPGLTGMIYPAQIPEPLSDLLVNTIPGQVILDPFCGSGQILKSAKKLGRDYIGIDMSPVACNVAKGVLVV